MHKPCGKNTLSYTDEYMSTAIGDILWQCAKILLISDDSLPSTARDTMCFTTGKIPLAQPDSAYSPASGYRICSSLSCLETRQDSVSGHVNTHCPRGQVSPIRDGSSPRRYCKQCDDSNDDAHIGLEERLAW
jgi:hypothetical protein